MRHFLLLLTSTFLFSFCTPEPCLDCGTPPPPPPIDSTGPFEILWMTPLNPDTAECVVSVPIVYNGKVQYSMLFYMDGYELFRSVDAKNGAPIWAWDPPYPGERIGDETRDSKNNLFLLTHGNTYYCLDMNTGQSVWTYRIGTDSTVGDGFLAIVGNHVYSEHSARIIQDTLSYYVRADINTGKWDTLFSLIHDNYYRPHLFPPTLWIDPQGDSILIMQNRQWNFPLSDGKVDILAYNLRTRQFVWANKDIDPIGNSSVESLLVYDNKVYFLAQKTMYCLDAATGTVKWKWDVRLSYDDLMFTNMLVLNGKIYVKPSNEKKLYAFDPNNGTVLEEYDTPGSAAVTMAHHNGILYYCANNDGKLYALNLTTKQWLWKDGPPNRYLQGKWSGNAQFDYMTLSPEHNCLFVGDRYFMMAIKLIQ